MREILFRGKDLQDRNGWIYGQFYKSDYNKRERESGKATLIFTPNCDTFIYCPEYHNSWMVKPETIGQYTGFTDKNGKKIFEGDILKFYGEDGDEESYTKYEVIWLENGWHAQDVHRLYMADTLSPLSWVKEHSEVIGNIYDNPELLEGDSQ